MSLSRSVICAGFSAIVTTGRGTTSGWPVASRMPARLAGTRRSSSRSPSASSLCMIAGSQTTRQPLLPRSVIRTVLWYDQGEPLGSVQSSLIALDAISPVTLVSPSAETISDSWGRSPASELIWSATLAEASGEPSAVTKPTWLKSRVFQPARKSFKVSPGPSFPHAARPPPRSTTTKDIAAARWAARKRPRAVCGERRMSSPSKGVRLNET
jgi:hypothetical protein